MMERVEIVVLNWNGWQDTIACIFSIQKQDYPNFHLLVVDNGSTDDSVVQIKKAAPAVELLQTGANLGFGGGCNAGIRLALDRGADFVWLINSDSTADVCALSALVRKAQSHQTLGAVGSVLYEMGTGGQVQLWGGGRVNLWLGQSHHQLSPGKLDFISGASLLLRCAALEKIGLFDQATFFMYWEDTDLAFRLQKAGWQLAVADDSKVWHKQSASLGKRSPLLDEYFTQSAVRFLRRYARMPRISIALMLGLMLIKRVAMAELSRVRSVMKGYRGA